MSSASFVKWFKYLLVYLYEAIYCITLFALYTTLVCIVKPHYSTLECALYSPIEYYTTLKRTVLPYCVLT